MRMMHLERRECAEQESVREMDEGDVDQPVPKTHQSCLE